MNPHVILQVVARAETLVTNITGVLPRLVSRLHVAAQVGGRSRPVAALLAEEPLAEVESPVGAGPC